MLPHDRAGEGVSTRGDGHDEAFREHERLLWSLCFRMTGCAADADDLVQETFLRAIERPPARIREPWRPWLTTVAVNLGRDLLRRRRRRGAYVGPWLPSPIETGEEESPPAYELEVAGVGSTEGRYDLLESVTFAFLLALDRLTPLQRAVLLLRDVFDYSVRDTAKALGVSEGSIKTGHNRARRAMRDYDGNRGRPTRELQEMNRRTLQQLLSSLANSDVKAVEALLSDDVRAFNDSGGQFRAPPKPIVGRRNVASFYANISAKRAAGMHVDVRPMNGLPALVVECDHPPAGEAPRFVVHVEVGADGRIRELDAVLAARKLTAVRFAGWATARTIR